MLDSFVLKKLTNYLKLIRFSKPIGFLLLMWPCWFGLSILDLEFRSFLYWLLIFFIGSFTMRSAGCIINDIIDKDIDYKIKRTIERPLASNAINILEAISILIFFLLISFFILLQFNFASMIVGLLSIPLVVIYPFMKRITNWPQIFLGIIFSLNIITLIWFFSLFHKKSF